MLELLAPAGSQDALIAAVQSGADAVYLGYGDFNARRNAKNFTREQLVQAVEYCHVRGVKVYLTLNTLLADGELAGAAREVAYANDVGVDAVLVQDLGVLALVRRTAPEMPVHASTQMSLMDLDGVKQAADLGCTRAVLARELPMSQIGYICQHAPIEIETFAHGAQCMCYSGQCFFSSVIGTRSGNRGLCAQPCRLNYSWPGQSPRGLLSLKDMSLAGHLRQLEQLGVACVKLEGRMKRPEYVAVVTGIYARAIREGREPTREELEQLRSAFSRQGFSDGYFTDNTGGHMFGQRQEEREPKELFAAARADYGREHQRVGLTGRFVMERDAATALTLTDGEHTVTARGEIPQPALNRPTDAEEARQRLSKTGGTPYRIDGLEVEGQAGLMVPAAGLNALRRQALEKLTALRGAVAARPTCLPYQPQEGDEGRWPGQPEVTVTLRCREQLTRQLLQLHPAVVYLPLEEAAKELRLLGQIRDGGSEPSVILPRVLWDREKPEVEDMLSRLRQAGCVSALVGNLGGIPLARRAGLTLRGDFGLEVYNSACARHYQQLGLTSLTLSFEQRLSRVRDQNKPLPCELPAYGRLPLMITENCIYQARDGKCRRGCEGQQAITDRKKAAFPVLRAYGCRNEIFNSLPLWLADRREELSRTGVWALRLGFALESPEECVRVLRAYQGLEDWAPESYTRGLYYREVE